VPGKIGWLELLLERALGANTSTVCRAQWHETGVLVQPKFQGKIGGERGIRTLDGLLTHTPLAGVRLRPLGHLSEGRK
jgi:hypothetical protein